MSQNIPVAFVKQYHNNIYMTSQQKQARIASVCRQEVINGNEDYFERMGPTDVVQITSRHQDTPQIDSDHSRRRLTMNDWAWSDMIDDTDKIRMIIDPTSKYVQNAVMSMNRKKDDVVISAALGNAYSGVDGATSVPLPSTQYLGATNLGAFSNLNIETLRAVKEKFDAKEVDDMIPRYFVCGSSQIRSLLGQTEVTNSDYNSVKALVAGQIDTFMGFTFIRTERLYKNSSLYSFDVDPTSGAVTLSSGNANGARQCFAFAGDGLIFGTGMNLYTSVKPRPDKLDNTQVLVKASFGATRMEEEKVVAVLCNEA